MMDDLYDLIGARPDDDAEDLRKAYRKAVKATHPDHHRDDPEAVTRFMEIAAAYRVLRDRGQRAAYDEALARETAAAPPRGRSPFYAVTFAVVLAVALSGGIMALGRVSGNADVPARAALHGGESAAMPVIVPVAAAAGDGTAPVTAEWAAPAAVREHTGDDARQTVQESNQENNQDNNQQSNQEITEIKQEPSPERTASAAAGDEPPSVATAIPTAPQAGADTAASPPAVVAAAPVAGAGRRDDPDAGVKAVPAVQHPLAASGGHGLALARHDHRADPRTPARMHEAAGTEGGDGGVPAPRRPAADPGLEHAALASAGESCGGQSCSPGQPRLFGIGF